MTVTSVAARDLQQQDVEVPAYAQRPIDVICREAFAAFEVLRDVSFEERATLLRSIADALDASIDELVEAADRETGLGDVRLSGEVKRSTFQLRAFADAVEERSFLESTIDPVGETALGPRPDLRRTLLPIGPVAVFGASNFPFAFSTCGGDTAAALAAGNSVVIKAHPSHPLTAIRTFEAMRAGVRNVGLPESIMQLFFGLQEGLEVVSNPFISAVGFTGSEGGGQALALAAAQRPSPIPFYGELGSVNPLIVTPNAVAARGEQVLRGYFQSLTLGSGQFCTKPSILFWPSRNAELLSTILAEEVANASGYQLLNNAIKSGFEDGIDIITRSSKVQVLSNGSQHGPNETGVAIGIVHASDFEDLGQVLTSEYFGPGGFAVLYASEEELMECIASLPAALVAGVHGEDNETLATTLIEHLQYKAGRLIWNEYPTGVSVTWAMTHGGPHPASNSVHSSVGPTSMRRFLRPVTFQNMPEQQLPTHLTDSNLNYPHRYDGKLVCDAAIGR